MARDIDSIDTSDFLTAEEIKQVRSGYRHMVDSGYSKLNGLREVFRSMAVSIECARREIAIEKQFAHDTSDQEFHLRCDIAGFRNLVSRSRILDGAE